MSQENCSVQNFR